MRGITVGSVFWPEWDEPSQTATLTPSAPDSRSGVQEYNERFGTGGF